MLYMVGLSALKKKTNVLIRKVFKSDSDFFMITK